MDWSCICSLPDWRFLSTIWYICSMTISRSCPRLAFSFDKLACVLVSTYCFLIFPINYAFCKHIRDRRFQRKIIIIIIITGMLKLYAMKIIYLTPFNINEQPNNLRQLWALPNLTKLYGLVILSMRLISNFWNSFCKSCR